MLQTYEALLNLGTPGVTTDGSALTNSPTLTEISPTPDFVLPANFLVPGSVLRIRAAGRFSTTATPTLLIGAYYGGVGGVVLCTTGAVTTLSAAATNTWRFEAYVTCRTIGSSGTVMAIGEVVGVSSLTGVNVAPATAPAVATINTTAASSIVLGAQWGATSASDTITCHQFLVESVA